jgi:hypothetical protein
LENVFWNRGIWEQKCKFYVLTYFSKHSQSKLQIFNFIKIKPEIIQNIITLTSYKHSTLRAINCWRVSPSVFQFIDLQAELPSTTCYNWVQGPSSNILHIINCPGECLDYFMIHSIIDNYWVLIWCLWYFGLSLV